MPKSKSKQNRDFQKVKLKVGKKLPKAANFTETRFKVAQIRVHQKLHQDTTGSEPTTHRKLNFKDLITQLHHHNSHTRGDGVTGLLELINSNEDLIITKLALIITNVAPMFYDNVSNVRRMCATLFHKVLSVPTMRQLAPFVPVIFAHLGCAMTHIDEPIQLDSLRFIDAFIDGPPELLSADSGSILKNFIELIAKYHSSSSRLLLVVDPISKRASQKWRQKILKRLDKFLRVQLAAMHETHSEEKPDVIQCDGTTSVYYQPLSVTSKLLCASGTKSSSATDGKDITTKVISEYTPKLLSLLLETWADILPNKHGSHQHKGMMVQTDTAVTLTTIASIASSLLTAQSIGTVDKISLEEGIQVGKRKFHQLCTAMTDVFPLSQIVEHDPTVKVKGKNNVSSTQLNLTVCDVVCRVTALHDLPRNVGTYGFIVDYIRGVAEDYDTLAMGEVASVLSVCRHLLVDKYGHMLEIVQDLYTRTHDLSQQKRAILVCLTSVLTDPQYQQFIDHPVLQSFVQSLPSALESVAGSNVAMETAVLDGLKVACRRRMLDMSRCLDTIIDKILPRILAVNHEPLVSLLYYAPTIPRSVYRRIADMLVNQSLPRRTATYLLHILHYRCVNEDSAGVDVISDYLSFVTTVLCGKSLDYSGGSVKGGNSGSRLSVAPMSDDELSYHDYHWYISQDLCAQLCSLQPLPVADLVATKLFQSFDKHGQLSTWAAAAIFILSNTLRSLNHDTQSRVTELAVAVLLSIVANDSTLALDSCKQLGEEVTRFLYTSDPSIAVFFATMKQYIERDDLQFDEAYRLATLVLNLLQTLSSHFSTSQVQRSCVNEILDIIQSRCGEIKGQSVWSEVTYLASIV